MKISKRFKLIFDEIVCANGANTCSAALSKANHALDGNSVLTRECVIRGVAAALPN